MSRKKKLKWGETPFHKMTKDELLFNAVKMFTALESAKSALKMCANGDPSLFWQPGGTGYRGLFKSETCVKEIYEHYSSDDVYRNFYRYGTDLLFPDMQKSPKLSNMTNWRICSECGDLIASENEFLGRTHLEVEGSYRQNLTCLGTFKEVTFDDLMNPKFSKFMKG